MAKTVKAPSKRERLVKAATELFHTRGIISTSLKDIAEKANVPLGNIYYYFKTKQELGLAAGEEQSKRFRTMMNELDSKTNDPKTRVIGSLEFFKDLRESITKYGCPIAQVCIAVNPAMESVGESYAKVYKDYMAWIEKQFRTMGFSAALSHEHATHIIVGEQGACVMAKALGNPDILTNQINKLIDWVNSLKP